MLPDIQQKIKQDFGDKATVVNNLFKKLDTQIRGRLSPRLMRAILFLANGDMAILQLRIKQARVNSQGILLQAEYDDDHNVRIRDFENSF